MIRKTNLTPEQRAAYKRLLDRLNVAPPVHFDARGYARGGLVQHDHAQPVEGCARCDLSRDEVAR